MKVAIENKAGESDKEEQAIQFNVLFYTEPDLRRTCHKVKFVAEELKQTIMEMAKTMLAKEGVGLAAPQVGINKRFFLFVPNPDRYHDAEEIEVCVAINPQILEREGESIIFEGCLSYPDYVAKVNRALKIKVRYQDMDMNRVEEEFIGLAARVFQHELDHLDGILFVDRMIQDTLKHVDELAEDEEKEKTDKV